jgi:RNA ligase (TIGR02306 family)
MSTFKCPVVRVAEVINHPNADRLSIVGLEGLGYTAISGKLEDGSPRYKAGDVVVYIPSAAVLPEWLLRKMDFWNAETNKGMLAGSNGDRVKPLRLRGIFSEGVLYPAQDGWEPPKPVMVLRETGMRWFEVGEDASEHLGITKWSPPIPVNMAGEVANLSGHTVKYDFERIESVPDMFAPGEQVVATEKLHGCLHGDSMVMLPNGEEVSMREVIEGDYIHVLSYDLETGEYITREITGKMRRPNIECKRWVKMVLEDGRNLVLTSDHPVYSRDRKAWINASDVQEGEDIESPVR